MFKKALFAVAATALFATGAQADGTKTGGETVRVKTTEAGKRGLDSGVSRGLDSGVSRGLDAGTAKKAPETTSTVKGR